MDTLYRQVAKSQKGPNKQCRVDRSRVVCDIDLLRYHNTSCIRRVHEFYFLKKIELKNSNLQKQKKMLPID